MLLGELQIDANNSHYKHFENALYMESLSNEYAFKWLSLENQINPT